MKNYIDNGSFIKTRNEILADLKTDFLNYLLEKYDEAGIAFKRDGKTKEIVFKAGSVTDKEGNFPLDVYASIDIHVKNYIDTKISGRDIEAYDFNAEIENYNTVCAEKIKEKEKKAAEKKAKIARDKAAREKAKNEKK